MINGWMKGTRLTLSIALPFLGSAGGHSAVRPQAQAAQPPQGGSSSSGDLTPGCQQAQARSQAIQKTLDAKASAQIKAKIAALLNQAPAGSSPAAVWNDFAAAAYLEAQPDTALWAEVHALGLAWQPEYVANAGIYLLSLGNTDDAKLFLHCAYDMGWRSSNLFEALALAHDSSGGKEPAKQFIQQALDMDPADLAIQVESSWINTGKLPPPPSRKTDDLDQALDALEHHFLVVKSEVKARMDLRSSMNQILGRPADPQLAQPPSWEADIQKQIDNVRQQYLPLARMSLEEFRKTRFPQGSQTFFEGFHAYFRDLVLESYISTYIYISLDNISSYINTFDVGFWNLDFWARAMNNDALSFARQAKAVSDYFNGPGYTSGPFLFAPGSPSDAQYRKANKQAYRTVDSHCPDRWINIRKCVVEWCALVIPAYNQWEGDSKSAYQTAAVGFDRESKNLLDWAAAQVLDARRYAGATMRGYRVIQESHSGVKSEDAEMRSFAVQSQSFPGNVNGQLRHLATVAAGNPQNDQAMISNYLHENMKNFAGYEQSTESELASEGNSLTQTCSPVAREVLKKLNGDDTDATAAELFKELVDSLNAKWEWKPKCSFNLGPIAKVGIEMKLEGEDKGPRVKMVVPWKFYSPGSAGQGEPAGVEGGGPEWSLNGSASVKFDAEGRVVQREVTAGVDVGYDVAKGYAEVALVQDCAPGTGACERFAEVKGSVGFGAGGVSCYPGEESMKMKPRVVASHAIDFLRAIEGS